jgi:hypothetical protein
MQRAFVRFSESLSTCVTFRDHGEIICILCLPAQPSSAVGAIPDYTTEADKKQVKGAMNKKFCVFFSQFSADGNQFLWSGPKSLGMNRKKSGERRP